MKANSLIITVRASTRTPAMGDAVYAALTDLSTHLDWAGKGTGDPKFRLLTMDHAGGDAVIGTRFTSTGVVQMGTFHDETVVTDAERGSRFAFITESVLERPRGQAWRGWFEHRYALAREGDDTVINYECDIHFGNYVPYWWRLPMRPMTRFMVGRRTTASMRRLGAIAEASMHAAAATLVHEAAAR